MNYRVTYHGEDTALGLLADLGTVGRKVVGIAGDLRGFFIVSKLVDLSRFESRKGVARLTDIAVEADDTESISCTAQSVAEETARAGLVLGLSGHGGTGKGKDGEELHLGEICGFVDLSVQRW